MYARARNLREKQAEWETSKLRRRAVGEIDSVRRTLTMRRLVPREKASQSKVGQGSIGGIVGRIATTALWATEAAI
jgi:hypothetical protein